MKPNKSSEGLPANSDLIEGAGDVIMDEPQMWGAGIIGDFKRTVGTHWFQVSFRHAINASGIRHRASGSVEAHSIIVHHSSFIVHHIE
jgi:hypothetical protein